MTVGSNSTSLSALHLRTQSRYLSYAANESGFNGSVHYAPPTHFY